MTVVAPARSLQQRHDALARADHVRLHRARLKERLKAREEKVIPLIVTPPDWLLTMRVGDLLLAQHRWGRVKVAKVLHRAEVSPAKTVGGLTGGQRRRLVEVLERWPDR
jgi:hypothetical protein